MRRYTSKEMTEILTLAEEMRQANPGNSSDTYSLSEMQTVASEMGMDPTQIALAAAQYESGRRQGDKANPWRHHFVRQIPFQVSDTGWERMVDEMRGHTGSTGSIRERSDGSQEWTNAVNGVETIVMRLTNDARGSTIDLKANHTDSGAVIKIFWGFAFFLTAIMGFAISSKGGMTATEVLTVLSLLSVEIGALFGMLHLTGNAGLRNSEALADRLAAAALSSAPENTPISTIIEEPQSNELRA